MQLGNIKVCVFGLRVVSGLVISGHHFRRENAPVAPLTFNKCLPLQKGFPSFTQRQIKQIAVSHLSCKNELNLTRLLVVLCVIVVLFTIAVIVV